MDNALCCQGNSPVEHNEKMTLTFFDSFAKCIPNIPTLWHTSALLHPKYFNGSAFWSEYMDD